MPLVMMGDMQIFPHKHKTVNSQEECCRCHSKSPQPKRCAWWGDLTSFICWDCICSGCLSTFNIIIQKKWQATFLHSLILPKIERGLPSRKLTYPQKMAFWRWISFSPGGISWPLVSWGLAVVATSLPSPVCTSSEGTRALEGCEETQWSRPEPRTENGGNRNRTHQKQVWAIYYKSLTWFKAIFEGFPY